MPTPIAGKIIASRKASLPKSTLPGTEPGISKSALATFIALDIINEIAPAIAIPLVLNRSTQAAALNEIHRVGVEAAFAQNGPCLSTQRGCLGSCCCGNPSLRHLAELVLQGLAHGKFQIGESTGVVVDGCQVGAAHSDVGLLRL